MRELALTSGGEDVIRGNRDRLDFFTLTRILSDVVISECRSRQDLIAPLSSRNGVGNEDQGRGVRGDHRADSDDGLPCATGKYDNPGTTL